MKEFPLELMYRLYKANIGDVIDNTYVRLDGGWRTDDDRQVYSMNGLLESVYIYQLTFKDLSDGEYYRISQAASLAHDPNNPNRAWYHEPYTINTIDPFPAYRCKYETRTVSIPIVVEDIPG